jgi:hypothetical protein
MFWKELAFNPEQVTVAPAVEQALPLRVQLPVTPPDPAYVGPPCIVRAPAFDAIPNSNSNAAAALRFASGNRNESWHITTVLAANPRQSGRADIEDPPPLLVPDCLMMRLRMYVHRGSRPCGNKPHASSTHRNLLNLYALEHMPPESIENDTVTYHIPVNSVKRILSGKVDCLIAPQRQICDGLKAANRHFVLDRPAGSV